VTLSRRELVRRAAVVAAAGSVLGPAQLLRSATAATPTLSNAAARSGRYFGSCASLANLLRDPAFASLLEAQCSVVTPEVEFKWSTLQPLPGQFNFALSDLAVSKAESMGLAVRGNCFTWANGNPFWFDVPQFLNPGNALKVLEDHITAVVSRYKGRVTSWDVVNEATNGAGYYPTPWARLLGPRYIDNAFTIAHRADPTAQLVMNEYNLEYTNRYSRDRQKVVLRVLDDILSRDIPIHALGVQAHLEAEAVAHQFDPKQHRSFLRSVAAMGLKIVITELDVNDINLPTDHAERDRRVAETYARYLDTVLTEPAVVGITSWGLTDRYSWMNSNDSRFDRKDGEDQRPLLYDADLKAKASHAATLGALGRARRR
jgi:endo-1,4-beta-xylanase